MKAPRFWHKTYAGSLTEKILSPLSVVYEYIVQKRLAKQAEYASKLPVICVGNVVMGGSGKTPVVQSIVHMLQKQGKSPVVLMRGYGGNINKTQFVDTAISADIAGDEALLHAHNGPVMVSADRVAGAKHIEAHKEITHIVMDDGFQNPSLYKNMSFIVLDGENPFGNDRVFPAGPLRETMSDAFKRAQALIILGNDTEALYEQYQFLLPVFQAVLEPVNGQEFQGKKVFAFAGIGRPQKFFDSLDACGAVIETTKSFADHHFYSDKEIATLLDKAAELDAIPVTTRKDWVRLPEHYRQQIKVLDVALKWHNPVKIEEFLRKHS